MSQAFVEAHAQREQQPHAAALEPLPSVQPQALSIAQPRHTEPSRYPNDSVSTHLSVAHTLTSQNRSPDLCAARSPPDKLAPIRLPHPVVRCIGRRRRGSKELHKNEPRREYYAPHANRPASRPGPFLFQHAEAAKAASSSPLLAPARRLCITRGEPPRPTSMWR